MEQQSISSDLIRGHIDTIILHTLLNGDKFAQQISDTVEQKSENVYKLNQATLYSSLKRLENLKLVVSYWQDCDNGGRRKFFKLTTAGKYAVESNLKNWSFSRTIIDKLIDCEHITVKRVNNAEELDVESSILSESEHVESNKISSQPIPVQNVIKQTEQNENTEKVEQQEISLPTFVNTEPIITQPQVDILNEQELNFRDILSNITPKNNKITESNPVLDDKKQNDPTLTEEELNFRNILNNLVPNKNTPEQSIIDLSGINVIDLKNETNVKIVEQNINETNNKPLLDDNSTEQQTNSNAESDQERNFRKVLRDLIKPITKKKEQPEENLQAIKPIETEDTKKDLSIKTETTDNNQPSNVKYSLKQKSHFSSRNTTLIDYTDLRLMASQDGLKLRISSKTSSRSIGTLFINKLRLITSLSMFLISLIQLLVITTVYKTILQLSPGIIFAIVAIFAILPLIFLTKYLRKPTKTISKVIHKDSILTTAILVFNLILINFACIMLINLDFTILKNIVVYAIIPAILYIDILLCSIIRYFMANSLICKIPNKKTAV